MMNVIRSIAICFLFLPTIILFILILNIFIKKLITRKKLIKIGIFHPHCDSGGGGERVLWMMIAGILQSSTIFPLIELVIYSTTNIQSKEIVLNNVMKKFRINIPKEHHSKITFVPIPGCHLLDGSRYLYFTMLFQILAMMIVGYISLHCYFPDIIIDTTGAPFMYPIAKFFGCKVITYIHYPLLSSDMMNKVREMRPSYNNDERIASNQSVSNAKLLYYRFLGYLFSLTGYAVDMAFVNSTWTERHMLEMWQHALTSSSKSFWFCGPKKLIKLFPPCNTTHLQVIPLGRTNSINKQDISRQRHILSIGQFRPEKDHPLQILSFARFLKNNLDPKYQQTKLIILGSCRNSDDEKLLNSLKKLTNSLNISSNVEFIVNAPFERLEEFLSSSSIGLHTMWNEHFGISIVEMLAAGLLVIAHNSGGPAMDIINGISGPNQTGYLASTEEEYARCMRDAIDLLEKNEECLTIRSRGRDSTKRFSDEIFVQNFVNNFQEFLIEKKIK